MISKCVNDTIKTGEDFAKKLKGGEVVLLRGDLGAGKTHFVKGAARGLGVTQTVTSPTFTLHNIYEGAKLTLNHFDFYRISEEEAAELGLEEYFNRADGVCFIEWAENIAGLLPKNNIIVNISVIGDNEREITILNFE